MLRRRGVLVMMAAAAALAPVAAADVVAAEPVPPSVGFVGPVDAPPADAGDRDAGTEVPVLEALGGLLLVGGGLTAARSWVSLRPAV